MPRGRAARTGSRTAYCESVRDLPGEAVRRKSGIGADGCRIGRICPHTDPEYMADEEGIPAIGPDIPDPDRRNRGYGTEAFRQYMDCLRARGYTSFFTQTRSGNAPMMRAAEKPGFREASRKKGFREVNGQRFDAITYRPDL